MISIDIMCNIIVNYNILTIPTHYICIIIVRYMIINRDRVTVVLVSSDVHTRPAHKCCCMSKSKITVFHFFFFVLYIYILAHQPNGSFIPQRRRVSGYFGNGSMTSHNITLYYHYYYTRASCLSRHPAVTTLYYRRIGTSHSWPLRVAEKSFANDAFT